MTTADSIDTTPGSTPWTAKRRHLTQLQFFWKDTAGTPIDLTGYALPRLVVAESHDSTPVEIGAAIATPATAGQVTVTINGTNWAALDGLHHGVFELAIDDPDGELLILADGTFTIEETISTPTP